MGGMIVCVNPWGRLKVGRRYVWVDFNSYCVPTFFTDAKMSEVYDPVDESDPVWPEFGRWLAVGAPLERGVRRQRSTFRLHMRRV